MVSGSGAAAIDCRHTSACAPVGFASPPPPMSPPTSPLVPGVGFYVDVKRLQSSGRGSDPPLCLKDVRIGSAAFGESQQWAGGVGGGEVRRA